MPEYSEDDRIRLTRPITPKHEGREGTVQWVQNRKARQRSGSYWTPTTMGRPSFRTKSNRSIVEMADYPPTGLDDELPFGKHEGTKLWVVLETDPTYVRWLIEEADIDFHLDDEAWQKYQDEIDRYEKYEERR